MSTMKALRQLEYAQPLTIESIPIPAPAPGTAIIKILLANIITYTKNIYNGQRKYPYTTPLTAGTSGIGRIHALGPDSTSLQAGQLVFVDCYIRSRDEPAHGILCAITSGHTKESEKLFGHWRNGSYAEYQAVPLENVFRLDEERMGELGYGVDDMAFIPRALVCWGGLRDIDVRAGETVIVAPATGGFGSAAVHCALALGASVVAMGRNRDTLARLVEQFEGRYPSGRIFTVGMTNVLEEEVAALKQAVKGRKIDAYLDIGSREASQATYLRAAIQVVRHGGRISLMGGQRGDIGMPYNTIMRNNLSLKGRWMYERSDVEALIQLIMSGNMPLGWERAGISRPKRFKLEEWEQAFEEANTIDVLSGGCVLVP